MPPQDLPQPTPTPSYSSAAQTITTPTTTNTITTAATTPDLQPRGNEQVPAINNYSPGRSRPLFINACLGAALLASRPLAVIVPAVVVVLNIWWSVTQRVCPGDAGVGDECFWLLWLSLPIATLTFLYAIANNISTRRQAHHMSHIPLRLSALILLLLALGSTICFALLIYHLAHYNVWSKSSVGGMAALIAILTFANWMLFLFAGFHVLVQRHARREAIAYQFD